MFVCSSIYSFVLIYFFLSTSTNGIKLYTWIPYDNPQVPLFLLNVLLWTRLCVHAKVNTFNMFPSKWFSLLGVFYINKVNFFYRTLVAIAECYFSPHYFDHNLIGAQADQQVLKDMVKEKLPRLFEHLEGIDIELSTITLNWFLAVFFDAVPFQVSSIISHMKCYVQ